MFLPAIILTQIRHVINVITTRDNVIADASGSKVFISFNLSDLLLVINIAS